MGSGSNTSVEPLGVEPTVEVGGEEEGNGKNECTFPIPTPKVCSAFSDMFSFSSGTETLVTGRVTLSIDALGPEPVNVLLRVGTGDPGTDFGDGDLLRSNVGVGVLAKTCICWDDEEREERLVMTGFLSLVKKCTSKPWKRPTTPSQ